MKHLFSAIGALALGAGAMYYFDPQQGRRRRALFSEKFEHFSHEARDYANAQLKHTQDQGRGLAAAARSYMGEQAVPNDEQLNARVRSLIGRKVSYPSAIHSRVEQGRVTLSGHILGRESGRLTAAVWSIPHVTAVDNQLQVHDAAGNEPSLQGEANHVEDEGSAVSAVVSAVAVAGGLIIGLKLMKAAAGMPLLLGLLAAGGAGAKRLSHAEEESQPRFIERRESPRTATTPGAADDPIGERGSSVLH